MNLPLDWHAGPPCRGVLEACELALERDGRCILHDVGLTAQTIARDVIDQVVGTKVPQAKPARSRSSAGAER